MGNSSKQMQQTSGSSSCGRTFLLMVCGNCERLLCLFGRVCGCVSRFHGGWGRISRCPQIFHRTSNRNSNAKHQTCPPPCMCILRALLCSIDNDVWYCLFIHSYTNLCCVLLSNKDHTFSTFSFFFPSFPSPSSLSCPFSSHHHSPLFSSNIPWPPVES